jgi:hypothetical protein
MADALGDRGEAKFEGAPNVVSARICEESGLLATSKCTRVISESFLPGTVPTKFCDMHEATDFALRDSGGAEGGSGEPGGTPPPDF